MSYAVLILLLLATVVAQTLIGGTRLVYSLPAYSFVGLSGMLGYFCLRRRELILPRFGCVIFTLAMAAYLALRAGLSPIGYLARNDLFMIVAAALVYLLTALVLARTSRRMVVLWALLGLAAVHVGIGVVQFRQGNNCMLLPWIYRSDYGARASGFYICPNHLAGLLEMLALLSLGVCCWGRGRIWLRLCSGYFAVLCLLGTALTGSRGGFVSLTAGCVVFAGLSAWALRRLRRTKLTRAIVLTGLAMVLLLGSALLLMLKSNALATRVGTVYDPANMRLQMWSAALQQFRLNPVFGTGAGTYYFYGRQFRDPALQNDPLHVHNDYLELLAEYGVVGVLLMAAVFGVHLYSGWRGLLRIIRVKMKPANATQSTDLALTLGALCGVAALVVHSALDFNFHIPANSLVAAFLFGILANPANLTSRGQERAMVPAWLQTFPPVLGFALAICALAFFPAELLGERARLALRDHQPAEAREFAARAIAHEPANPDLHYYRGEAEHYLSLEAADPAERERHQAAAVSAFEEGLRIFPQDVRLLLKLGRTLDSMRNFPAAEEIFQRAFKADPRFSNVYAYYALHSHLQGLNEQAEQYYQLARDLGEKEISAAGLRDLEREERGRRTQVLSVFGQFVTPGEDDPAPAEETPILSRP